MSFAIPEPPSKRKREDDDGSEPAKVSRIEKNIEEPEAEAMEILDLQGLKRLILNFERKINKNQQMRIKFSDQAEKFMDSEIELDQEIKQMMIIATVPTLYGELVKLNAIPSLVGLMAHENTDICIDVIDLFHELLDVDIEEEEDYDAAYNGVNALVDSLIENQTLELLIQGLGRFDEKQQEDAQAVFNTFSIVENFVEIRPSIANLIVEKTDILQYLLKRIKIKSFDGNKLYASEIIAILLQNSKENQRKLVKEEGLDTILFSIAAYKKQDPQNAEEEEMLGNLFDSLCSCLLIPENRPAFLLAEGIELMLIILKNKKLKVSRKSALRVINFAITRTPSNCRRFVDILGLKTLFKLFMKATVTKGATQEDEEAAVSCISSLLIHLDPHGNAVDRVLNKFRENDFEKVERLLELHEKYLKKVKVVEAAIDERKSDGVDLSEEEELGFESDRLDAGLFTLQLIDVIFAIISTGDPRIKERVQKLFKLKNIDAEVIKNRVNQYIESVG
eukprot:TRINITY_DN6439_c0_g1_i1.p1 TRINITY_DN6439_c0_g1~~TRINITY_DN6439_c0_g1_i1.p1  ORF type:complete len:506 (-),score=148.30 TRINITY_DN6439_c0_g1_i1:214-1731(-)